MDTTGFNQPVQLNLFQADKNNPFSMVDQKTLKEDVFTPSAFKLKEGIQKVPIYFYLVDEELVPKHDPDWMTHSRMLRVKVLYPTFSPQGFSWIANNLIQQQKAEIMAINQLLEIKPVPIDELISNSEEPLEEDTLAEASSKDLTDSQTTNNTPYFERVA